VLKTLSTSANRKVGLILLMVCCAAAIAAGIVGIDDNPPGILLAFLSAAAFVLVFVHPWRTARQFALLLGGSILAFVVFAILHNLFHALDGALGAEGILQVVLQGFGVVAFLLAVLVCPPAIVVAAVGTIILLIRNRSWREHKDVGAA
jgi:hypothetical protein